MHIGLLLSFTSTSSAIVHLGSAYLLGLNGYVEASSKLLYNDGDLYLPDIPNDSQTFDPASLITPSGADEQFFPALSQALHETDLSSYSLVSVGLAGLDEGLGLEDSTLLPLSDYLDSELAALISCEPDASSTVIQRREEKSSPSPEQCFDDSGGICPRDKPNLVCCQEKVMYTDVIVRSCTICT